MVLRVTEYALRVGATAAVVVGLHVAFTPVLYAQGGPVITPPQHVTVQNNVTVTAPAPDPAEISAAATTSSQAILNTQIAPAPLQWANALLGLPDIWRTTPDDMTWNNGAIRTLAELIGGVGLSLIALAIFARGIAIALGREDWSGMGRLLFAATMSFGNLIWWRWGIQLNNAINDSIAAPPLPSLISPHLVAQVDPVAAVGTVILLVVYAITALLLLFSLLFRLGLVDILIACGGLALICYATTQTEYIASHYVRISVAVLFSQVIIVICLRCASVLATLGTGGVVGTLIAIAILWLARSAPQQILAGSSNHQGSRMGALVMRGIARRIGL